jgi:hypothetical protein
MARWFRSHVAKLESHKVQLLSDAHYRAWESLLCVAALHDGVLPSLPETAFRLRKSAEETAELIEALITARLFDRTDRGIEPHDWNEWQCRSDVSSERVKRFRQRSRGVSGTPSESESDSEPDSDSEADASGAAAPDPVKAVFDEGVRLLTASGCSERNARTLIGKWRREKGDVATLAAVRLAKAESITEPIAWIAARLADKPRESWNDRRIREAREALQ